ncbi:hypothetical protein NDQ86_24470, partial [Salinispora arenicola]|nr:hypothetical protein [Salinispora arenicola]
MAGGGLVDAAARGRSRSGVLARHRRPPRRRQTANVKAIIEATKKAGMDERAAVVAIATSLQESKLENLGHL